VEVNRLCVHVPRDVTFIKAWWPTSEEHALTMCRLYKRQRVPNSLWWKFVIFGQWWQMAVWRQSTVKVRVLEAWMFAGTGVNATLRQRFGDWR